MKSKFSKQTAPIPSKDDLLARKIFEGLQSGAGREEKKGTEKLLGRYKYVPKKKLKAQRKPGPRPSTNPVEEEIRTRLKQINLVLDPKAGPISSNNLLFCIGWIFDEFNVLCSKGLFIDAEQHAVIHSLVTGLPKGAALSEITSYLNSGGAIARSKHVEVPIPNNSELFAWLESLLFAIEENQRENLDDWIQRALDDAISISGIKLEERSYYEAIKTELPPDLRRKTKNGLLDASMGMLTNIQKVLSKCVYVPVNEDLENMYFFLSGISQAFHPNSGINLPFSFSKLDGVFRSALKHQTISPFRRIFDEEFHINLPDLTPGFKIGPANLDTDGSLKLRLDGRLFVAGTKFTILELGWAVYESAQDLPSDWLLKYGETRPAEEGCNELASDSRTLVTSHPILVALALRAWFHSNGRPIPTAPKVPIPTITEAFEEVRTRPILNSFNKGYSGKVPGPSHWRERLV